MTQAMSKAIRWITGREPMREGELPDGWTVGYIAGNGDNRQVTRIERREEYRGTYSIIWFDVFVGEELFASMNGMDVAVIRYEQEDD